MLKDAVPGFLFSPPQMHNSSESDPVTYRNPTAQHLCPCNQQPNNFSRSMELDHLNSVLFSANTLGLSLHNIAEVELLNYMTKLAITLSYAL